MRRADIHHSVPVLQCPQCHIRLSQREMMRMHAFGYCAPPQVLAQRHAGQRRASQHTFTTRATVSLRRAAAANRAQGRSPVVRRPSRIILCRTSASPAAESPVDGDKALKAGANNPSIASRICSIMQYYGFSFVADKR